MQFVDLAAQQLQIKDKIDANIQKVLDHGKYIMGPEVKALEEKRSGWNKYWKSCPVKLLHRSTRRDSTGVNPVQIR